MKNPPSISDSGSPKGLFAAWTSFWFTPADSIALSVLRVLGGVIFLYWLLPFAGDPQAYFGVDGWFDTSAYREASRLRELPPHLFTWSAAYWCGHNATLLVVLYWLSIAVVALFALGVATRLTGVLNWAVVVSFTANPAIAFDADPLLQMLAFYLMLGYLFVGLRTPGQTSLALGLGQTRATWLFAGIWPRQRVALSPSIAVNVALRLLQVHFAIAVAATGLHKLQTSAWWSGLAPWFYLHPPFHSSIAEIRSYAPPNAEAYLNLFSITTYAVLAWQIGFPAFAWRRWLRPLLLGGAAIGWLMTALALQIPLVGPLTFVICLAYLTPTEWYWVEGKLAHLPIFARFKQEPTAQAARNVKNGTRAGNVIVGNRS